MTVDDLIDQLGGSTKVAELFGVGITAVSNWRVSGQFPERLHYRVYRECEERGIELPADFFEKPTPKRKRRRVAA